MGQSSSTNSQEISQTSYPQWTQDAQQGTFQAGTGMLQNFLRNPQYSVAGFTADTMKGMDLARNTARTAYTSPAITAPGMGQTDLSASTVGRDQIMAGMNPYLSQVGDVTLDAMRREQANTDASLASKYAASGAMGGSGEGIARGQAARGYNQNVAQAIAQIQSQGYDRATALALANAQMQNSMKGQAADYGIKQAQVNDNLRTTQQAREMSALQQLMQQGVLQQGQAQRALDVPWTALERLMALTPRQTNSQTVSNKQSETESSNPVGAFGEIVKGIGGLASIFSDRNAKTDIEKVGKDPETGDMLYAYRYKGDPKSYPKVVGPMAQDIEKRDPSAVQTVGGKKIITGR
jgi:hypothetical protein